MEANTIYHCYDNSASASIPTDPIGDDIARFSRHFVPAPITVKYSQAPAGAGKTYEDVRGAVEMAYESEKVFMPQPTTELIDKTVCTELSRYRPQPLYTVLHNGTNSSVADAITAHTRLDPGMGQILFTTQQVMSHIRHWSNKSTWHLRADEEFQVIRHQLHQLLHYHHLLTDYIDIKPIDAVYGRVLISAELEERARNPDHDDVLRVLAETSQVLVSPYWETYVNMEQYERLRAGKIGTLAFLSILSPEILRGFGSISIRGANIIDSAMFQLWKGGVSFVEDQEFTRSLRYQSHPNGDLITIWYATEEDWSTKLRTTVEDGVSNLQRVIDGARKVLGDEPFIWQANKSIPDILGSDNRLPNKPHGLNTYAHINNVLFLPSLNPPPDHFRFLKSQGMSGNDVRRAIYYPTRTRPLAGPRSATPRIPIGKLSLFPSGSGPLPPGALPGLAGEADGRGAADSRLVTQELLHPAEGGAPGKAAAPGPRSPGAEGEPGVPGHDPILPNQAVGGRRGERKHVETSPERKGHLRNLVSMVRCPDQFCCCGGWQTGGAWTCSWYLQRMILCPAGPRGGAS